MKNSVNIVVSGKVQNVGFRYYTIRTAQEFNISGFVKNRADGTVYIEAEGEKEDMEKFVLWCRKGPAHARVDACKIQEQPVVGYNDFKVK